MNIKINPELEKKFNAIIALTGQDADKVIDSLISNYIESVIESTKQLLPKHTNESYLNETNFEDTATPTILNYKAVKRIESVARRKNQFNHWMLKAFFHNEKNGVASKENMKNYFVTHTGGADFDGHFNSMKTDASNAHGHYFDCFDDEVTLFKPIEEFIRKYKGYFD